MFYVYSDPDEDYPVVEDPEEDLEEDSVADADMEDTQTGIPISPIVPSPEPEPDREDTPLSDVSNSFMPVKSPVSVGSDPFPFVVND